MCGIGGVWCLNNSKLDKRDSKRLIELAIYLQSRGDKAFGFYNGENVIKFPSSASDVIEMIDKIKPFSELVTGKRMFLMHTREPTVGDPLKNKNNHPFELKDIVFAHNGMLYEYTLFKDIRFDSYNSNANSKYDYEYIDTYEILGKVETDLPETDSFEIGVAIQEEYNKYNDFIEALERALSYLIYFGDMALWIYSKREDLLALFKFERPLFYGFKNSKLWFASEKWMLESIKVKKIKALKECELLVYSRDKEEYNDFIEFEVKGKSLNCDYHIEDEWDIWRDWKYYF